ncbi:SDR family oxidoreductase [Flavobacterium sp. YJ01]|uniref:SDR family oxidoreductase n=1 Tax=Flavobacterium sp. YJ01 TaxID=3031997 RepID=UPI0023E3DC7E|nr:SDR family oxidoreductase [Flavobacterium sp. YJ01]WET03985.1 SDR family oxidoreductase [Flavobacterium sp. YJ01]
MNNIKDTVTVITGASSGIGAESARYIASQGGIVVLIARNEQKLIKLADEITAQGGRAVYMTADVSSADEMQHVQTFCREKYGKVDNLVNNAGLMLFSYWKDAVLADWNKMVDVNIKGYLNGIAAFLPGMVENNSGTIVNMSSVVGMRTGEGAGVYSATKFFIAGMTESLRKEVGTKHNIQVAMVSPGTIDTGWADKVTDENGSILAKEVNSQASIKSSAIASAVVFILNQEKGTSVNDITVAPTSQNW